MFGRVAIEISREQRSRADKTHLAAEHVPKLGQLVEA
jgi:hypothetical protein